MTVWSRATLMVKDVWMALLLMRMMMMMMMNILRIFIIRKRGENNKDNKELVTSL